jgi:uncharacterized NAD(P)/FAD-binding protein YdhS
MKKIGIIGGGFTGTMTAVQIIEKSVEPVELIIVNKGASFNKGIAYEPYSKRQLLNVVTAKMSAFPDRPDHFLDWVMTQSDFIGKDKTLIANSFLPRSFYGIYLSFIWEKALNTALSKKFNIRVINQFVTDLDYFENKVVVHCENGEIEEVEHCIVATGNNIPGNPTIKNSTFFNSQNYYRNPWDAESVKNLYNNIPILIIGNGLTMVDSVVGLLENGFKGKIYSISPNGFNILPHRHSGIKYSKLTEELDENASLYELVCLVNKHIKSVREFGLSAEPVIDSLRPHTQRIWRNLSEKEKQTFMSRLRHLWGVARHRIPLHIHDKIQQLRIDGRLQIKSGKITDIFETDSVISVEYLDKKESCIKKIEVSRVINCTGPETDLTKLENDFLKNCLLKGIITQDKLRLGIRTNVETFEVTNSNNKPQQRLYTLGSNLKGELWESTAVNELRKQAENLAEILTSKQKVDSIQE